MNQRKPGLPYRVPTDIKPILWWPIFIIVTVLWAGMMLALCFEGLKGIVLGLLFGGFFLFCLLKLFPYLVITEQGIVYREFFKKTKISWATLQKVETNASFWTRYFLKGGMIEMDLFHEESGISSPVAINLKVFTKDGLISLVESIASNAPQAELDEITKNIQKGIMPSLVMNLLKHRGKGKEGSK